MSQERRQYSRIHFSTEARLYYPSGESSVELLDLSLKGALVTSRSPLPLAKDDPVKLQMPLDELGTMIRMEGLVTHNRSGQIGILCTGIDLDSITHLRRLVELNLGDEALLEREWHHLIADCPPDARHHAAGQTASRSIQGKQTPLQREEDGQTQRQRVAGEQAGVTRQLFAVTLSLALQRRLRHIGRQIHRLVIDNPAHAVGHENTVNDVVDRDIPVTAGPRLLGAAVGMGGQHPAPVG